MKLTQQPSLRLDLKQECALCGEDLDQQQQENDLVEVAFCGVADPYVICPGCLQRVPESLRGDPEYRRKVRVKLYEKFGRIVREPEGVSGSFHSVWRRRSTGRGRWVR